MITAHGLRESFARVKSDVMSLQANILEIAGKQAEILEMLSSLRLKERNLETKVSKRVKVVRAPVKSKTYVASKTGKSFHVLSCPFAKNIQPKSVIKFKSTDAALNKGLKACECVKRI